MTSAEFAEISGTSNQQQFGDRRDDVAKRHHVANKQPFEVIETIAGGISILLASRPSPAGFG